MVGGEEIVIGLMLIAKQFSVNIKWAIDVANALIKEAQIALKNIIGSNAFMEME